MHAAIIERIARGIPTQQPGSDSRRAFTSCSVYRANSYRKPHPKVDGRRAQVVRSAVPSSTSRTGRRANACPQRGHWPRISAAWARPRQPRSARRTARPVAPAKQAIDRTADEPQQQRDQTDRAAVVPQGEGKEHGKHPLRQSSPAFDFEVGNRLECCESSQIVRGRNARARHDVGTRGGATTVLEAADWRRWSRRAAHDAMLFIGAANYLRLKLQSRVARGFQPARAATNRSSSLPALSRRQTQLLQHFDQLVEQSFELAADRRQMAALVGLQAAVEAFESVERA